MAIVRVDIKNSLIEWAISRAGHEIEEYLLGNPKVRGWLTNDTKPTVRQLEEFSKRMHVPFGYFFLPTPPQEEFELPFFRTGSGVTMSVSLNVYDAFQIIQRRQDWLTEYLQKEGYEQLSFVGKFDLQTRERTIVNDIRDTLGISIDWASNHSTWEKALDFLTVQVEKVGIIINFNGVVGDNTTRVIDVSECRGFVLVDKYAPFMFINNKDAKAAQMFTIAHELAHIWLGKSVGFDMKQLLPDDDPIEIMCDKIAAELLVPSSYFMEKWRSERNFTKLSKIFKVSPIVVARRALDLGRLSRSDFFTFYNSYISEYSNSQSNRQGGGDYYATKRKRISSRFANFVHKAVKERKLLYRDAYKLTGLKGKTYATFVNEHLF